MTKGNAGAGAAAIGGSGSSSSGSGGIMSASSSSGGVSAGGGLVGDSDSGSDMATAAAILADKERILREKLMVQRQRLENITQKRDRKVAPTAEGPGLGLGSALAPGPGLVLGSALAPGPGLVRPDGTIRKERPVKPGGGRRRCRGSWVKRVGVDVTCCHMSHMPAVHLLFVRTHSNCSRHLSTHSLTPPHSHSYHALLLH